MFAFNSALAVLVSRGRLCGLVKSWPGTCLPKKLVGYPGNPSQVARVTSTRCPLLLHRWCRGLVGGWNFCLPSSLHSWTQNEAEFSAPWSCDFGQTGVARERTGVAQECPGIARGALGCLPELLFPFGHDQGQISIVCNCTLRQAFSPNIEKRATCASCFL